MHPRQARSFLAHGFDNNLPGSWGEVQTDFWRLTIEKLLEVSRNIEQSKDENEKFKPISEFIKQANASRKSGHVFITENGEFGIGGEHVRSCDYIYVILGCDVPLVLRPAEKDRLGIIGDAYVPGIMNGEAVEGIEGPDAEELLTLQLLRGKFVMDGE